MKETLKTIGLAVAKTLSIAMMVVGISGLVTAKEINELRDELEELKDEANN